MRKGETRIAYQDRIREELRNRTLYRLEADERFIEMQLANIRRRIAEIAERTQSNAVTKGSAAPLTQRGQMMNEQEIENKIQEKGLNAPRLNPAHIDSVIKDEAYFVFPGTTLTVCCLTLNNGFTVTGESAAASPENFNAEIGRDIARKNAREKIWALEGYLLRERLSQA